MRLFSTESELGVIGFGQHAWGLLAIGQTARGLIAVGQGAIGVVAVGQAAFGIVAAGMVGGGVAWFAGMIGIGGRGFCLRLIPGLDLARTPPPTVPLEAVWAGAARGFVRLGVADGPRGAALMAGAQVVPVKFLPRVAWALDKAARSDGVREIFASLRREGPHVICDSLVEVPGQRKVRRTAWVTALRIALLVALATAWCWAFSELVLVVP